jgi:hypothetical protein
VGFDCDHHEEVPVGAATTRAAPALQAYALFVLDACRYPNPDLPGSSFDT